MLSRADVRLDDYRVIAISPHFDDVALSLSGLLLKLGQPALIVTVHGGAPDAGRPVSEWDADCGFASPESAYRTRLAEDAASCAAVGAVGLTLANADGPYRDDSPFVELDELVRAAASVGELYLPAAVDQPDHRRVRDQAIAALADRPDVRPCFYADLPYASASPGWLELDEAGLAAEDAWPEDVRALRRFYPEGLELAGRLVVDGELWEGKRRAVLHHASQLALVGSMGEVAGLRPLLAVDGLLTVEAFWRPRAVAPVAARDQRSPAGA